MDLADVVGWVYTRFTWGYCQILRNPDLSQGQNRRLRSHLEDRFSHIDSVYRISETLTNLLDNITHGFDISGHPEKGFLEKCRWLFCGFEISVGEAFRPSNWPKCRGWKASFTDRGYDVSTIRFSRSGKTQNPVLHLFGITGFSGDLRPFQILFPTRGWKKESGSGILLTVVYT